jgi:hypothetical protein
LNCTRLLPVHGVESPDLILSVFVDGSLMVDEDVLLEPVKSIDGRGQVARPLTIRGLGLDEEPGEGVIVRQVKVKVASRGAETQSVWVFGATEAPAGRVVNPVEDAGPLVR